MREGGGGRKEGERKKGGKHNKKRVFHNRNNSLSLTKAMDGEIVPSSERRTDETAKKLGKDSTWQLVICIKTLDVDKRSVDVTTEEQINPIS